MTQLYLFKFKAQPKETVWGGTKLNTLLGKSFPADKKIGESWELSAVQRNLSVVANGFLKGNNIEELIEIYMGDIVGEKIYELYGVELPLMVKLIDAEETLSVQVHPDNDVARERHDAYGKTEMWYVVAAEPEAVIYVGFNRDISATEFYERVQNETLLEVLNCEKVKTGDVFFIPPGTIHAIGKGIVLAEIQQTSDITYRIYDWGREHNAQTARDMHIEHAIDVIDYVKKKQTKTVYKNSPDAPVQLVQCPYFTTTLLDLHQPMERNLLGLDSFVVYVCIDGSATIECNGTSETIAKGETILAPAALADLVIKPSPAAKLLETYIE